MEWYLKVLRQFRDFSGRARRKEYWMFTLINGVIALILSVLDPLLGLNFTDEVSIGLLYTIYLLVVIVPGIAVSIRRMHDIGRSGWSLLFAFIPFVGVFILLYWFVKEGEPQDNAYGPDPKAEHGYAI